VRFKPPPSPKGVPVRASENERPQRPPQRQQAGFRPPLRPPAARNRPMSKAALDEERMMAAALRELEERGEEWGCEEEMRMDLSSEWSCEQELARTRALADKVKKPTPPALSAQLNVFIGAGLPRAVEAPKSLAASDWEALPAGTRLAVWWAGNEEYFECTIKDWHVNVGPDGALFYTHRCEYDYGCFDHDLSRATFNVLEVAQAATARTARAVQPPQSLRAVESTLKRSALNGATPKRTAPATAHLSPRRRWLASQETQCAPHISAAAPASPHISAATSAPPHQRRRVRVSAHQRRHISAAAHALPRQSLRTSAPPHQRRRTRAATAQTDRLFPRPPPPPTPSTPMSM
jgi:hypothetical protein